MKFTPEQITRYIALRLRGPDGAALHPYLVQIMSRQKSGREIFSAAWHICAMPIYEFACPKCRKIYSFLSKRVNPQHLPVCPKCGSKKLKKEVSRFAMSKGLKEAPTAATDSAEPGGPPRPDLDDPRVERAMMEMERDMAHLDENNPRHMAHMMKKMKNLMPPGAVPKELDVAIKRLEAGEDPEKIEADMGDVLDGFMGGPEGGAGAGAYAKDSGLYDY